LAIIINPKSDEKGRKVAIGTIAAGFPFNHALTIGNRKPPYRNKLFKTNGLQAKKWKSPRCISDILINLQDDRDNL
jgi:hypothetical protein